MTASHGEQGSFPGLTPKPRPARRPKPAPQLASKLPVARLALDLEPAHLDRLFDYAVPAKLSDQAQVGVRVSVRFAGRRVKGYLVERVAISDHKAALAPLERVVSPLPVLTKGLWRLVGQVARRYAGTRASVLRLAIPPLHLATETSLASTNQPATTGGPTNPAAVEAIAARPELQTPWSPYTGGASLLRHLASGSAVKVAWLALPWVDLAPASGGPGQAAPASLSAGLPAGVVAAVASVAAGGRQSLVICPNERQASRLHKAIAAFELGPVARLVASDGPAARMTGYDQMRRGQAVVGVGTRAAVYQPMARPGLIVVVEPDDPAMVEPHAPYPHVRQIAALAASESACSLIYASTSRSVEIQAWVDSGWLVDVAAPRELVRQASARVEVPGQDRLEAEGPSGATRLPGVAFSLLRQALPNGPVLVQVPRAGYVTALACAKCRQVARCPSCQGPLSFEGADQAAWCRNCASPAPSLLCRQCGGSSWHHLTVGAARTAQELGRAFGAVPLVFSAAEAPGGVIDSLSDSPALVVATPGSEPVVASGYAAAALLDGGALTGRPQLDATTTALRHWTRAASLVRPASQGGRVLLLGWPAPGPAGALVRWDPSGFAARELSERQQLGLPPATKAVVVTGPEPALATFQLGLDLPASVRILEPGAARPGRLVLLAPIEAAGEVIDLSYKRLGQMRQSRPGQLRLQVEGQID
ncbi:MAG: primosomal protein N' [Micrococcales bacterium]|nr:primosomal protein N' [Micrococcales bacterium]